MDKKPFRWKRFFWGLAALQLCLLVALLTWGVMTNKHICSGGVFQAYYTTTIVDGYLAFKGEKDAAFNQAEIEKEFHAVLDEQLKALKQELAIDGELIKTSITWKDKHRWEVTYFYEFRTMTAREYSLLAGFNPGDGKCKCDFVKIGQQFNATKFYDDVKAELTSHFSEKYKTRVMGTGGGVNMQFRRSR